MPSIHPHPALEQWLTCLHHSESLIGQAFHWPLKWNQKSQFTERKCTLVWPSCPRDLKSSVILWSPLRWTGQDSLDLSRWDWLNYFRISEICELWFVFWWVSPSDPPDTIIRALTCGRKRREMRLWKENQQRKGIWSKTGEATLMQHWLQNWAIIECQKSSAQCIHGWLTRQIARGHTVNRKPIFRSRDHYPPIRWESYSSKSEQVDQELIPTFIVRAMEMSLSFPSTNSSCICKSDSATTTSIFNTSTTLYFISLCSLPGRPG